MFTWICPQCGHEVPPSYTDCPNCKPQQAAAVQSAAAPPQAYTPAVSAPPAPAQPSFVDLVQEQPGAPPPPPPAPAPVYEPPTSRPPSAAAPPSLFGLGQSPAAQSAAPVPTSTPMPAPRRGLPTWLLTIVFAAGFAGLVGGVYWLVGGSHSANSAAPPAAAVASPAATAGAAANPYQKYIEVSGIRFLENSKTKKPEVKFAVTNHSNVDITGLGGTVNVWGSLPKSGKESEGSFQFTTNISAWETKDLTVPLDTKKEMIELPDWQFVTTDLQVTAPKE